MQSKSSYHSDTTSVFGLKKKLKTEQKGTDFNVVQFESGSRNFFGNNQFRGYRCSLDLEGLYRSHITEKEDTSRVAIARKTGKV